MNGLKRPLARQPARQATRPLRLAVTSGKGGVGKTTTVANLALSIANTGLRTTIVDGDMGLANLDVLLGLTPQRTLEHFFRNQATLDEIVLSGPRGIRIVPAGSGLPELTQLCSAELLQLVEAFDRLQRSTDLLIIDTPSGISDQVSRLIQLCDRVLVIAWPEPTALVDAYAALKVIHQRSPQLDAGLLVNGARDATEAERVHRRIVAAAEKFLGRAIELDGFIVHDGAINEAARRQRAVVLSHPLSPASRCFERLALHIAALARTPTRGVPKESWPDETRAGEIVH
ncbi:MAG: MinD/ParA family protein [Acidobacteriota bacterium]|nr:MAG: MinD/ParA family protein [Acidobacteriota bacterium]